MSKLILPMLLLSGCVTQPVDVDKIYRKDLRVQIDKTWGNVAADFTGMGVLDQKPSYNLTVFFNHKPTKFTLTTCHREVVWSNPGNGVKYTYTPEPSLEYGDYCPIEMGAFDDQGRHAWGMIDFRGGSEKLPALLNCNGETIKSNGVSLCQTKTKLMQKITFEEPVKAGASEGCPLPKQSEDMKSLILEVGRGKCLYLFKGAKDYHRMITFGYDDVILR